MPAAYSLDLRQKAIAAIDRGEKKSHVSRTLKLSRNTLDLWLKRRTETGSLTPKTPVRKGPDPKINDLEAFKQFATEHGRLTAQRMAELWPESVSDVTLGKALKRIGFTRKKDLWLSGKG
jgi:transposase